MQRLSVIYLLFIAIFTVSCTSRVQTTEKLDLSNGGVIQLKIESSSALTKLTEVPTPHADEFLVKISSTTADENGLYPVVFEKKYGEMTLSTVLKEGEYNITASSGENEPFSTETPTYTTSKKVDVEIGQTSEVNLTATIHSYLVDIVYTEEFKNAFTEYYIEAHVVDDRYSFAAMGDQVAYLAPGSTTLVLKGMTAAGQPYSSVIKEISSVGRERYVLTLAIRPQGQPFDVTVDTQVEQIGVGGNIDDNLYPDMPDATVGALTFYETAAKQETSAATSVTVRSIISIESVELTFTNDNVSTAGLEANRTYNFGVAEDAAALTAAGIVFAPSIIGERTSTIDFSLLATKLLSYNNTETAYNATIRVVDKVQKSETTNFSININPPVFQMNSIPVGNCWTKEVVIPRGFTVINGDQAKMVADGSIKYQYSTDQINWIELAGDELDGLTPATKYYVRALYRGDIPSEVSTFSTEAARQIPNSDFESWQDTRETKGGQYFYRWKKDGEEWWSSLNSMTCTSAGIDAWQVSQSSSRTCQGRTGLGVLMHTAGWGSGNTWAGTMWAAIIYNTTAGKLFLGQYSNGQQNGKEFNSRPTAVTYWYKFTMHPKKADRSVTRIWVENRTGDVTTTVGEGSFTASSNVGSYTQNRIDITYSNTTLPATHICMEFRSGANEGSKDYLYDKTSDGAPFADQYYYYGSRFWLDDVELIYEK